MKVKFTSQSKNDGTYVTINLAQLDNLISRSGYLPGDKIIVTIEGEDTVFKINRLRKYVARTAATHCFPRFLRLPKVGQPVFAEVTGVRYYGDLS